MNKHFTRIVVGALLGIALLTVPVILLDKMPLLWAAYACSVWAVAMFAIGMGFWATGSKIRFVLNAAYPLVLRSYLFVTLLIAVIFCGLAYTETWTIKWGWFCLIEFAVFAVTAWRLQAMDAGREAILATGDAVKVSTVSWKMLVAEISAIAGRSDSNAVSRAAEAVRFADPVEHPAVAGIADRISGKVGELGAAVDAGESEKIAELCTAIERLVKERANKLMIVK